MPKVIDKYKRFVADEKEMSAYNERDTFLYGQAAMLQYEREVGKKEGIEIGIEQGIEKGIEKGYKESQINIAKEMKKENMDNDVISRITGLTIEEIKKLWASDKFTYQIFLVNNFLCINKEIKKLCTSSKIYSLDVLWSEPIIYYWYE